MVVKIACYYPAENPCFVPITIDPSSYVQELVKEIYQKLRRQNPDVKSQDLLVYKVRHSFQLQDL